MNSALVFIGGALQVFDELLQFFRHGVERRRQFADLGAGFQVHALGEIAARNGPAGLRQHLQRAGDAPRRKNAKPHAHKHGQPSQQASRALHFVDAAIGLFARLLHHDRPIQRGHWTVGSQHFDRVLAIADGEFPGRRQLGLRAFIHKTADDVEVAHVLSGGVLRGRGRHQSALAVHDVGHQSGQADLLQSADQVIHIDHRADHPQEAASRT